MAIIIGKQSEIQDYFDSDDINQSSLKDLAGGLDSYLASLVKKRKDKEFTFLKYAHHGKFLSGSA